MKLIFTYSHNSLNNLSRVYESVYHVYLLKKNFFFIGPGFETTAYPSQQQFMGQQFFNDPMASMAMQYGTSLADQGREYVHKNVSVLPVTLFFLLNRCSSKVF